MRSLNWQLIIAVMVVVYAVVRIIYVGIKHDGERYRSQKVSNRNFMSWSVSVIVIAALLAAIVWSILH